jgi:hypothetical protein
MKRKYPCPCCGLLTLDELPPGTYEICPVCEWEDDPVQFNDPDYIGGANVMSLNQAKKHFIKMGAADAALKNKVRPPHEDEKY